MTPATPPATFMHGLPKPLYDFWLQHKPSIAQSTNDPHFISNLLDCVVQYGSIPLLELVAKVQWCHSESTSYDWIGQVLWLAIIFNRPDMLEYAIAQETPMKNKNRIWREAIQQFVAGDFGVLEVLKTLAHLQPEQFQSIERCMQITDMALLKWLDAIFAGSLDDKLLRSALLCGDAEVVQQWMTRHPHGPIEPRAFRQAYEAGHLDLLRCLIEQRPHEVEQGFIKRIIRDHQEPVMQMLRETGGLSDKIYDQAVFYVDKGRLDELQALFNHGLLPKIPPFSIDRAASKGKLDLIRFLVERNLVTATTNAIDSAVEYNRWDVVTYLLETRSDGWTTRATDGAAVWGRLDFVKLFHEAGRVGFTTEAMDFAASGGYLDIVRFLHENRTEGCTTKAMDEAAGHNRLHVVQFLHQHRTEGCTSDAIDVAARGGHYNVVKFLVENRDEGCTADGVVGALKAGYLNVVRLLYAHYPAHFGPELMHDLLLHGAFDIWMQLRDVFPDEAAAVVEPVLREAGEHLELRTIHFIVNVLNRHDIAHLAMDSATQASRFHDTQWLRAVFAVAGPTSCRLSAVRVAVAARSSDAASPHLRFVIGACCESGAFELAVSAARDELRLPILARSIEAWRGTEDPMPHLDPVMHDPRSPSWAIFATKNHSSYEEDPFGYHHRPLPWAIRALYRGDDDFLYVVRDVHESSHSPEDPAFSFKGARAAAIRVGNLTMLQWLLENVRYLPVEPTLLDEAVYFHQFEIAQWLVAHCLEGCRELDWSSKVFVPWLESCGLDNELLDWLDSCETVQSVLDLRGLVSHAVNKRDTTSLKRLYGSHPDAFSESEKLMATVCAAEHPSVHSFLEEIVVAKSFVVKDQ